MRICVSKSQVHNDVDSKGGGRASCAPRGSWRRAGLHGRLNARLAALRPCHCVYFPAIGTLKSQVVANSHRSAVYNISTSCPSAAARTALRQHRLRAVCVDAACWRDRARQYHHRKPPWHASARPPVDISYSVKGIVSTTSARIRRSCVRFTWLGPSRMRPCLA
jgi:hypothetical protein